MTTMDTFIASIRSIGEATTIGFFGFYAKKRNFLTPGGRRELASISQQITMPLLLFTKIIYCNQDWSQDKCPDARDSIKSGWPLLFYPFYLVGCGLALGRVGAAVCGCPKSFRSGFVCAVTMGNSTGLPITLLTVIHNSFTKTTELGSIDPTLFLGVYLLVYPILQWGVGGFLLAPVDVEQEEEEEEKKKITASNGEPLTSIEYDALVGGGGDEIYSSAKSSVTINHVLSTASADVQFNSNLSRDSERKSENRSESENSWSLTSKLLGSTSQTPAEKKATRWGEFCLLMRLIVKKSLTPPVFGAVGGMIVALLPRVRSLLVDMNDRDGDAPLEWFFEGLNTMGQAAVPLNMLILGASLAATSEKVQGAYKSNEEKVKPQVFLMIVFLKLVMMPICAIAAVYGLRTMISIPDNIDAPFYLVMLVVACTPTANNVMVMAEIGGVSKEAMAKAIFVQYLFAPILLTGSVSVSVALVSSWR